MPRRRYSPEEIERGLTTLVIAGNSIKASELLGIPGQTIRQWKANNLQRYETLRTELHSKVAETIASEAEGIAIRVGGLEHQMIDRIEAELPDIPARDLPGAFRNISTAKALQMDKISGPLRERPAYVQQNTDIDGLINQMARRLGWDATATAVQVDNEAPEAQESAEPERAHAAGSDSVNAPELAA